MVRQKQWTLASGARAAREARIATVRFLDTPAMAQWHLMRLMAAYAYHKHHRGDHDLALGQVYGGMGYQPPYPGWQDGSALILADEARYLAQADLFVLSPQMCDVVTAAALTLTIADLALITAGDLPVPAGIVVLPHPVICRAVTGDLADTRAVTWRHPAQFVQLAAADQRLLPACRVSVYNDAHGPIRPESFLDFAAQAAAAGTPLPPLLLDAIRCWPYQQQITEELAEDLERYAAGIRQMGERAHSRTIDLGLDEDNVAAGEYTPGDEIDDHDDLFAMRFLYAFWRLCEQRIAVAETVPANHAAQVLAARAGVPADVRVVQLRRRERRPGSGGGDVEWRHRWPVRMHKVRQWYPSAGTHQILYRGPYVKGPEGKPLIGGDTTWGLVR